jgi:hypothetical protein
MVCNLLRRWWPPKFLREKALRTFYVAYLVCLRFWDVSNILVLDHIPLCLLDPMLHMRV